MSQSAFDSYFGHLKKGGILIIDKDLVQSSPKKVKLHKIGATDIAFKKFGLKIIGNIIIIGYLAALLGIVSKESLKKSIERHVPRKALEANLNAFEEGYNMV